MFTWYMMCPVSTRVPGVKVQVWNSCRARIPGNFFRRYIVSSEISTFPRQRYLRFYSATISVKIN